MPLWPLKVKKPSFFGYDFKNHKWAVPSRVIHDFLGYGVLLLTLAQATMGCLAILLGRLLACIPFMTYISMALRLFPVVILLSRHLFSAS